MAEEHKDERLPVAAPLATIATLNQHEGQAVTLRGWLYDLRASGKLLFPIFRDGTGTVQGIVPKAAVPPEVFERVRGLTHESSVIVTGRVRADSAHPAATNSTWTNVEVLQRVSEEDPFPSRSRNTASSSCMEHRHLWIRTPAAVGDPAYSRGDHQGRARLSSTITASS